MTKIHTIVSLAVAGLMLSTGASAAGFPASGEAPSFGPPAVAASSLDRADVRVSVAGDLPAAGELNTVANLGGHSTLSRGEVRAEAAQHTPAAGELMAVQQHQAMPGTIALGTGSDKLIVAAGEMPHWDADLGHSDLQRSDVRVSEAGQQPLAGNVPATDVQAVSTLERTDVRAEAVQHLPAAGEA